MPLVLSNTRKPLMPCTPKRARLLLERSKAAVFRLHPFTIILKDRGDGEVQPVEIKVDPGSKTTGIALVVHGQTRKKVVTAINLDHQNSWRIWASSGRSCQSGPCRFRDFGLFQLAFLRGLKSEVSRSEEG